MRQIIIEVRSNNAIEGDVSNYKPSIKSQLFGKAFNLAKKIPDVDRISVEPNVSLIFHR